MALSEAIVNKIKVLLYEKKIEEAKQLLVEEAGLSESDASNYVERLAESLQPKSKPVGKLLFIIFLIIGLSFLGLAGYLVTLKNSQLENSTLVIGVVVGFDEDDDMYAPVISYEVDGSSYQYTSTTYSTPPSYELNETVEIYINGDNPKDVVVNSFANKYLASLILGVFGFIFTFLGTLMLIVKPSAANTGIDLFDRDDDRLVSFDD